MLRSFRALGAAVILVPNIINHARAQDAQPLPTIDVVS